MKQIFPALHPGIILKEEFLESYKLTQKQLAESLGVGEKTVNEICRERRSVTPSMSLKLSKFFGNTPIFWLNLQNNYDLYKTSIEEKNKLDKIKTLKSA